jgi:hypothetical protein
MTMSDQTKINTAGPVDPGAAGRAKLYAGLALVTPLLSFLATFGIFTADQVSSVNGFLTAALGLLGTFGFGLAASKTNKQVHDGTFDQVANPVDDAFKAIAVIRQQADDTLNHAVTQAAQATQAIQSATAMIPGGFGGVTGAVLPGAVGDLIQWARDNTDGR